MKLSFLPDLRIHIGPDFPSPVVVERYGLNTSLCSSAWSDSDARVICREKGYREGIALHFQTLYSTLYYLYPKCNGRELLFSNCPSEHDKSICTHDQFIAEIFCFSGSGMFNL